MGGARSSGRAKTGDRSFQKTENPKRGFGRQSSSESSEGSSFSQRSRFAKRPSRTSSSEGGERQGGKRTESFGKPFKKNYHARSEKPSSSSRPTRTSDAAQGRDQKRSESFGKPFKKNYRPRSEKPLTSLRSQRGSDVAAPKSDKVRLNKFIANSGVSSRREADELIQMGLISVNGKVVTELGYKVVPGDEVRYESKVLRAEKPVYILMNKPKGFITTTDDPQERKTVMHIVGSAVKERIYPVGRLDRNTTGLLLLTNDGDLADKLMHPSFNVRKVYKVELDRALTKADFQQITEGVRLEEGRATVDDLAIVSEDSRTVGIELHIGWNRVVRRIFEALGYEVMKLDRTVYAGLDKKELARGQWRFLSKEEIIHLKHFK